MKNQKLLIVLILIISLIIIGVGTYIIYIKNHAPDCCVVDDTYNFNNEGVLLIYSWSPVYGHMDDFYERKTVIYNDGKVEIIHGEELIKSFNIKKSEITEIQNAISEVDFMGLDEDVEDYNSLDGAYYSITVNTKKESHTSKGLNPSNERFLNLEKVIKNITSKYIDY